MAKEIKIYVYAYDLHGRIMYSYVFYGVVGRMDRYNPSLMHWFIRVSAFSI